MNSTDVVSSSRPTATNLRASYLICGLSKSCSLAKDEMMIASVRAVLRCDVVEIVRRDHAAGARHVARDDGRVAGNMLAEMARDEARIGVVGAARPDRNDDRDGLAAVEVLVLRRNRSGREGRDGERG